MRRTATLISFLAAAAPAAAHHTGTPPVVRITWSGDNSLPRFPSFTDTLALVGPGPSPSIYSLRLFDRPDIVTPVSAGGNNANPAASPRAIAFDSDGDPLASGDPGRQVFVRAGGALLQMTHDSTGTSANPALNYFGNLLAFESAGDLAGTGSLGTVQVYLRDADGGPVVQLSRGQGTSRNPSLSRGGTTIAFDSTSDPATGIDTGISQIWLSSTDPATSHPITAGNGPSRNPLVSNRGRILVFESEADLASGGANTGIPQIFAYDLMSGNFAQVTQDPSGCTGASALKRAGDWRIAFTCAGQGFYHDLRADRRYRLPIDGGDTNHVVAGAGFYFLTVCTTANLLGTGTTAGHEIYLFNLYKRPAEPVSGSAVWFPARGLRPLR